MVPPRSSRISRVPPYSRTHVLSTDTGLSPAMARLSRRFSFLHTGHWPGPRSLAATKGVSVDVLSSGYLDVSVRRVCSSCLCIQQEMTHWAGFPHSDIHGSKSAHDSPWLFAVCHVLHRLSVPRHPPDALLRLIAEPSRTGASPINTIAPTFSAFGFPCSQHSRVPTTWGQDCNLFTMSNNAACRASSTYEYLISTVPMIDVHGLKSLVAPR